MIEQPPTGTLEAGGLASFTTFALRWLLFAVASLRARVFPPGTILPIVRGVIGLGFLIFPGAGILPAVG